MTWTRHGECNQCGWCCITFGRAPIVRDLSAMADPAFYEARGFQPMQVDGRTVHVLWASYDAMCPEFRATDCGIYDARPQTCRDYPTHPKDIVGTPCSYYFTHEGRAIGGDASPHPMTLDAYVALEGTL
jgi:Fe-S-cluster containining protein